MIENELFPDGVGQWCHELARELWPIARSVTGPGLRKTLHRLSVELPELRIIDVKSGSVAFDWTVPNEWTIRDAYIADEAGVRIVDFQ